MAVLAAMTKLEAVNRMLASIGQAPVNSIPTTGVGDAAKAAQQLVETARDVQLVGWSWNTDENYPLTPDNDGNLFLPTGVLDADATTKTVNVVARPHPTEELKLALYDVDNQTYDFSDTYNADNPLLANIVWVYDFDSLPAPARAYVATAAARRFQAQTVNSVVLDRFNEIDEDRAYHLLLRHERRTRDTNSFRRNAGMQRWVARRAL